LIRTIKQVAKYVYKTLGAGHEEAIYRDAMSVELQDRVWIPKNRFWLQVWSRYGHASP
jgi:hypothetical protein